jgi:repressor LexA
VTAPFPLTRRQQELLRFIAGYQIAHDGISPSYDEMRRGIGCGSKSNVLWLLNSLGERGVIERLSARARAIRILTPISIPLAPDGAPLFAVPLPLENTHADT